MLAQEASASHSSPTQSPSEVILRLQAFPLVLPPPPKSPLCSDRPGRFRPGEQGGGFPSGSRREGWQGNCHIMCSLFSSIILAQTLFSFAKAPHSSMALLRERAGPTTEEHNGGSRPSQSPTRPLASNRPPAELLLAGGAAMPPLSAWLSECWTAFLSGWPVFQTEKQNTNGSSG